MLRESSAPAWSEIDLKVFERLVPSDHYLRKALECIDFERFRATVASFYSADQGRPAEDPVRMIKLGFLQYHDNLSDVQVIRRATSDVAYRYFLGLSLEDMLPDPSSLCIFRGRLKVDGHRRIFQEVVAQAREHNLVKDRLRLKDATHVIAEVAIPTTLALVAQVREKLLSAAEPFDQLRVEGERARVEVIRATVDSCSDEERLVGRVTHLREILVWVDELSCPADQETDRAWQTLSMARQLAHKVLADQENPKAGDRTRSAVSPDVRRGKHGDWFDGYLLDIMMDPDSEVITAINILPANGDEAADAVELVKQEETAHGNDIESLSMDKIGFQGPVLRELQNPEGLGLEVYVPPKSELETTCFRTEDFSEDLDEGTLTCPGGHSTSQRKRTHYNTGWQYFFPVRLCTHCPLQSQCMNKPPVTTGRTVIKNEYELEYCRMRTKAQTSEYAEVRKKHPKVERKLAELVRWHGGRRARFRGKWKVLCGELMTTLVVNVKRIVSLCTSVAPIALERT